MFDMNILLAGKKAKSTYLYLDWEFSVGALINDETWVPRNQFEKVFGYDLKLFEPDACVQISFNEVVIQQTNIVQTYKCSYSTQFNQRDLIDRNNLSIAVTGLAKPAIAWNDQSVKAVLRIDELKIQDLPAKKLFEKQSTCSDGNYGVTLIDHDETFNFHILSPVYPWLLEHADLLIDSMQ